MIIHGFIIRNSPQYHIFVVYRTSHMNKNRRLEILGILIVSISVFILISLIGYNVSEEPIISPNVKIENPMGILGVFISHFLIKLSFLDFQQLHCQL